MYLVYPKEVTIRSGERVVLRPPVPEDEERLLAHLMSLPQEERHFLQERPISLPTAGARGEVLSLVGLVQERIVAHGAVARRQGPAYAHIGQVWATVSPVYRGRGLGTALLQELCQMAAAAGMELLLAEVVDEIHREALRALEWLGFMRTGVIAEGARGPRGERYDIIVMALSLGRWQEWTQY
ncbi:MAG: GNAT family N-acetyltransferase [Dehalococcoidia bacterium]|jgi:L-amino acid N-acyltransferase YncA|nr:GNAT family N-acetyltransferase [Dehalococcoidia bacterium]